MIKSIYRLLIFLIFFLFVSSANVLAQKKEKALSVKNVLFPPALLLSSLIKEKVPVRPTLSTIGESVYIGIGTLLDSLSGMSRSFALNDLLLYHPIKRGGQPLYPVLVDYTFTAPYAVSGIVGINTTTLRVYEKGKKVNEFILPANDWQALWFRLNDWIGGDPLVLKKKEKIEIYEGEPFAYLRHTPISEFMPGKEMEIKMYNPGQLTETQHLNRSLINRKELDDPYAYLREVFGRFSVFKEKELFFFDSRDVPEDAKNAARSFTTPLFRTPRPALQYLDAGSILKEKKDWGAAFQSCLATLASTDEIFVGPQEQALIREKTFQQMAELQISISPNRKSTESLFRFAAYLNGIYARNAVAASESDKYYRALDPLKQQLNKTTEMAYKIKGARFQGAMGVVGAFAGGLGASIGGASQSISQSYLTLMETTMKETFDITSQMRTKMNSLFSGMDRSVNATSFLAGQELQMDFGKPLIAAEVYFHLSRHPDLMKEPLGEFAADKPKLYKLLREFYVGKNPSEVIPKIYLQLVFIEQTILNYEGRNFIVPDSMLEKF